MTNPSDPAMPSNYGLTKREIFVLHAMEAMIRRGPENIAIISEFAVRIADATLLQMNRQYPPQQPYPKKE